MAMQLNGQPPMAGPLTLCGHMGAAGRFKPVTVGAMLGQIRLGGAALIGRTLGPKKRRGCDMDDFEAGAVIFLLIIVFGIAGYLAASFFQ